MLFLIMVVMEPYNEDIKEKPQLLLHPTRYKIMEYLSQNPGNYIAEISRDLDLDRKNVSRHLKELEKAGLVEASLEILEGQKIKGVAVKRYVLIP